MNYKHWSVVLLCIIVAAACSKQTIQPSPTDLGQDYQPLNKGHFIIYDVDSIIYDDFTKTVDTFYSEMKDEIGDEFIDDQGRTSHYVNRYQRKNNTEPWVISHIYYITQNEYRLEWKENNLRFIKMVYPVKLNKKWKGNSYMPTQTNTELSWMDDWDYRYTDVVAPYNTGSKTYNSCHIVDHADYIEGIPSDPNSYSARGFSKEVFAKGVGMIYREVTHWEYQANKGFRNGFTTYLRAKSNN